MFLWKFPHGYAKIRLSCERPERFVNRLLADGISVHNIKRTSKTECEALLRYKMLDNARALAEENGCSLLLVGKGGFPVFVRAALARPVLLIGIAVSVALLFALSRRVLAISVVGADAVTEAEVRELIALEGVRVGMQAAEVDRSALAEKLRLYSDCIGFSSVRQDGVVLRIELFVTEPVEPSGDERPASIYADKDCVIIEIAALDGRAMVSAGDAVKRGQLLISGDITPEGAPSAIFTQAKGEIKAEVAYRFSVRVEPAALRPARSGNTEKITRISLFGLFVDSKTGFEAQQAEFDAHAWLSASGLPIMVRSGTAYELSLMKTPLSTDEMIAEAVKQSDELLKTAIPQSAVMVSKTTEFIWNGDGSLTAVINIHTIENIGYSRYL